MCPMWDSSQGFTRRENECTPLESNLGAQYSSPRKQMVGFSWAYTIKYLFNGSFELLKAWLVAKII